MLTEKKLTQGSTNYCQIFLEIVKLIVQQKMIRCSAKLPIILAQLIKVKRAFFSHPLVICHAYKDRPISERIYTLTKVSCRVSLNSMTTDPKVLGGTLAQSVACTHCKERSCRQSSCLAQYFV